ncbi:DUF6461 domain-containing protein [Actinomadura sp. WAC 06369]|uniref:DUF6461 domain-containing protein n=1 Tax=Actinomadura sp. WAC 06369 TaxID=2203193 RepID=UPI000F7B11FB|nr:DUF6461 domain-containing protein [Actinomadura sp. WAC 06369]RSN53382.1 hypothetical protein DMH08_27585 [Actinomadura sp. WAC 06369]
MADPLAPFHWLDEHGGALDDIFCVSFLRGVAPAEVLRRFGPDGTVGREMSFGDLSDTVAEFLSTTSGGSGGHVGVLEASGWSVAVELWGWFGAQDAGGLSDGCEVVAVSRHDYAEDAFCYAVDGEVVTGFVPHSPARRWGRDPDRLNPLLRELDLPTDPLDDDAWEASWDRLFEHKIARVFALAAKLTGVPFTRPLLDFPLLVGPTTRR